MRRLTDASTYTGTHKHRFDKGGKGRGLAGRDSIAKGASRVDAYGVADYYVHPIYQRNNVHDLSLITRPSPSKAQCVSKPSRAKKSSGSPRGKQRTRSAPESTKHVDTRAATAPSIFSKLTDEDTFTGTHRKRPTPRKYNLSEDQDDDTSQSDASWSNWHAGASDPDQSEPGPWDTTSISSDSGHGSTAGGRYRRVEEGDARSRVEVGSPTTTPRAAARAEKAAFRRALHERKKAERRSTREQADVVGDQTGLLCEIDLDVTETHGDDSVALLALVRQQQAGMTALTQAILEEIEEQQRATVSDQLFDVKTDYTRQQKSVCIRIGTGGIEFLDSRATLHSLAVLPFSSIGAWSLTKPGRVVLTLLGSEKPVTIVSRQAPTISQVLTTWAPAADINGGTPRITEPTAEAKQSAAGATISFSRRFGNEFLSGGTAQSSPLSQQQMDHSN